MRSLASLFLGAALLLGGAGEADAQRVVTTRTLGPREHEAAHDRLERAHDDWHRANDRNRRDRRWDERHREVHRRLDRAHDDWHARVGGDRRDRDRDFEREHDRWHRRNDPRLDDRHERLHDELERKHEKEHRKLERRRGRDGRWHDDDHRGDDDDWDDRDDDDWDDRDDVLGSRDWLRLDLSGWGYPGARLERRGERILLFLPDGRALRLTAPLDAGHLLSLLASSR